MASNDDLLKGFQLYLRARDRSPKTITNYLGAARLLIEFSGGKSLIDIDRHDIEEFIAEQVEQKSASTAATRFRCLQQFYRWASSDEEGEVPVSPMRGLSPPAVIENPPDVLRYEQVVALVKACEGRGFTDRRDMALVRLMLIAGGPRLGEVTAMETGDVDLDRMVVHVIGKGRRPRTMPFSEKTALALSRYLRMRQGHAAAGSKWLWLGVKGRLTDSGITQALHRRAARAGIEHLHPHMLRHTAAHRWKSSEGATEEDMMRLFGWRSMEMVQRYGARLADERAHDAARRLAIDNDF